MAYSKLNLKNGQKWTQDHIAHLENGIVANEAELEKKALKTDIPDVSGLQPKGDYALKSDIPASPDLSGYVTDEELKELLNPITAEDIINDLLNTSEVDTITSYDLSKNFAAMLQPTCIDYSNAATVGNVVGYKSSSETANAITKCGFGHIWYLCNRDFTITLPAPYEFCIIGLSSDWKLVVNSGYKNSYTIKKYDPIDSTTYPWFSLIIHIKDNTSDIHTDEHIANLKSLFSIQVSKEEIDNNSDFPLVLGLTNFTPEGLMSGHSDFTLYGEDGVPYRNTLSLAYPIMGEQQVEQTINESGWYQGLTAYNADSGIRSHTPGRYPTMTWVETLKNENLFVYWSKTNDNAGTISSTITYDDAEALSKLISIKKRSADNPTPWIMGRNDNIRTYSHRIEAELSPKNSIFALEYGYNRGFRWFELDIRLTSDGIPVSSHDATYGSLSIPTSTYAELNTVDYGATHSSKFAGVRMLKLEDALIFCSKMNCGLNIELKPMGGNYAWTKEKVQAVYDLVAKYNMTKYVVWNQNVYLSTEATNTLQWLLEIDNKSNLVLLNSTMSEDFMTKAVSYLTGNNIVEVYAPASALNQSNITSALNKGLRVGTHWVSGEDTITPVKFKQYINMGITSIITESGNPTFYNTLA